MERQSTNRNKHRGDELEDIQRESQENRENRTQQGKQKQNNRKRKSKDQEGSLKTGASPSVCRFVQSLCETRHQGFLPESVSEDLSTTQVYLTCNNTSLKRPISRLPEARTLKRQG
eukprot:XP_024441283.1 uncharacterized protein LOC18104929 isoform X2 [Populus trichocarpa]